MSHLRTGSAHTAPLASVAAYTEPPLSPPVNRPVAPAPAPPAPAPAPVAPPAQPYTQSVAPAAPVPPPAPVAGVPESVPAAPAPAATAQDETAAVFLHLSSGERIWAGRFDTMQLAEQHAAEIVAELNRPEPGVWAKFGARLIRPDAVVSIELAPRRED